MGYSSDNLIFRPRGDNEAGGVINRVTAKDAGWELLNCEIRRLEAGEQWTHETGGCEVALVLLGGTCSVRSSRGSWEQLGGRRDVFDGVADSLYLPARTEFTMTGGPEGVVIAWAWVATDQSNEARRIAPSDCRIELRGGHNATRQINHIIPPGFDCHRIVACEVYTPGGNWSSYPPHKHDEHKEDAQGTLLEADLEEVYIYKVRGPRGYAIQRIYTDDRSIDAAVVAHDNDIVLVPEGYHPVSAAYGFDCYYLNFLAGSAQSLAATDDPDYAWTKDTWDRMDPRIPMVAVDDAAAPSR